MEVGRGLVAERNMSGSFESATKLTKKRSAYDQKKQEYGPNFQLGTAWVADTRQSLTPLENSLKAEPEGSALNSTPGICHQNNIVLPLNWTRRGYLEVIIGVGRSIGEGPRQGGATRGGEGLLPEESSRKNDREAEECSKVCKLSAR